MSGDDVLMRDPWDPPDPCGQPDILDWGPDFAEMAWTPPATDGGAEITHYVIEMKEKNMNHWVEGKTLTVKEVQDMGGKIKGKQVSSSTERNLIIDSRRAVSHTIQVRSIKS